MAFVIDAVEGVAEHVGADLPRLPIGDFVPSRAEPVRREVAIKPLDPLGLGRTADAGVPPLGLVSERPVRGWVEVRERGPIHVCAGGQRDDGNSHD